MDLKKFTCDNLGDVRNILNEYGVAILEDYFSDDYADQVFEEMKNWMIGLKIGLTKKENTWISRNMPLGPRYGMYQSIVSNAPIFWALREKFHPLFSTILQNEELITSIDGASVYPAQNVPVKKSTWAHIDQTESSEFMCYQSQFIATDTNASFVCTPKSHLHHKKILRMIGNTKPKKNWHKFSDGEVLKLVKIFGDEYQIPILAKKGSVIFWDSRTIHAAKYQETRDDTWRAVFYISMRPKQMFNDNDLKTVQTAVTEGLTTNHWATTIFKPFDRYNQKAPAVINLIRQSKSLSYVDKLTDVQSELIGLSKSSVEFLHNYIMELTDECIIDENDNNSIKLITKNTFLKKELYKILAYLCLIKHKNKNNVEK